MVDNNHNSKVIGHRSREPVNWSHGQLVTQ